MWHPDMPEEYKNQIVTGDARELAEQIPDESIDLILCDPDFSKLDDYVWIARVGQRILKEGGLLLVEVGAEYLPQIISGIDEYLDYVWLLIERNSGGTARMWQKRIIVLHQPYLLFSKGPRAGDWIHDLLMGKPDKSRHVWGDGTFFSAHYIECLTTPDDLICDPFTGGGTVPAACKMLSRNYIAFEIDPDTAELARERIRNTQPPLFVVQPEQLDLSEEKNGNENTG